MIKQKSKRKKTRTNIISSIESQKTGQSKQGERGKMETENYNKW